MDADHSDRSDATSWRSYDKKGRLILDTDAHGRVTRQDYNDETHAVRITGPSGRVTTWVFDPVPRPVLVINGTTGERQMAPPDDPALIEFGWHVMALENDCFRPREIIDWGGNRTSFRYEDEAGKMHVTDTYGRTTTYEDGDREKLVVTLDAESGRVGHEFRSLKQVWFFPYDGDGRLTSPRVLNR